MKRSSPARSRTTIWFSNRATRWWCADWTRTRQAAVLAPRTVTYRLADLTWDIRKALSLPPGEGLRRLSGRAVRYARRLRNRSRVTHLSDADLLTSMTSPASSLADLVARRREKVPLVPASLHCAATADLLRDLAPAAFEPILAAGRAVADGTFDLLGSGPVNLGPNPDWHCDFKSGKRWDRGA